MDIAKFPIYTPVPYEHTEEHNSKIEIGKYLVVRKDGKVHFERFNGSNWAYNANTIVAYYIPKVG